MALTIRHLNGDASFLLSFSPILPTPPPPGVQAVPFRILLDPWITGSSTVFHSKISISTHKNPACISSLQELPEPDLVVISQHKTDHCNEPTLRQLPASGTKTLILAEPSSARTIRSWKYFDRDKVRTIPKWDDSSNSSGSRLVAGRQQRSRVVRIPVSPIVEGGEAGEVTVAFITQRRDMTGLHNAVGITYRPPSISAGCSPPQHQQPQPKPQGCPLAASVAAKRSCLPPTRSASPAATLSSSILTPPATPRSYRSYSHLASATNLQQQQPYSSSKLGHHRPSPDDQTHAYEQQQHQQQHFLAAPPMPTSPRPSLRSLRSVRSVSSLSFVLSRQSSRLSTATTLTTGTTGTTAGTKRRPRTLSLLFSPHGISYPSLSSYVSGHLVAESALPLTALLHCFDNVSNPWWLGGNILLGAPAGQETAAMLGARAWISAHDGEKELRGLATALLRTKRYRAEELAVGAGAGGAGTGAAAAAAAGGGPRAEGKEAGLLLLPPTTPTVSSRCSVASSAAVGGGRRATEVLALGIGDQVVLSCDGVWNADNDDHHYDGGPLRGGATDSAATDGKFAPSFKFVGLEEKPGLISDGSGAVS